MPARIPVLYVILSVLVMVSVVPMYFYSAQVESINRERLITNERLLQNTVTRSLADDISQHQESLRMMLANLSSALQVASGGTLLPSTWKRRSFERCWKILSPLRKTSRMPRCSIQTARESLLGELLLTPFCNANWSAPTLRLGMAESITDRPWS